MLLVIVYLLFPVLSGLNIQLAYYKGLPFSGPMISSQIQDKIIALNITEQQLALIFSGKSEKVSKLLLPILLPLTALILYMLPPFGRSIRFHDRLILATEINIVVILLIFLILPGIVFAVFDFVEVMDQPDALIPVVSVFLPIYLLILFRRFYRICWLRSLLITVGFLFLYFLFFQVVYKFILFQIVFFLI